MLAIALVLLCWCSPLAHLRAQLFISELMASNDHTLLDEDGESSDWLELYNKGDSAINLAGHYLSDDRGNPLKWALPAFELSPGDFLLIFCSGKNRSTDVAALHSNFRISAAGEAVILSKGSQILQVISPIQLTADVAWAALPAGGDAYFRTTSPSPGKANLFDWKVGFSHEAGFYDAAVPLTLTYEAPTPEGVIIRYAVGGELPTSSSPSFTTEFLIEDRSPAPNEVSAIPTTPNYNGWDGEIFYLKWAEPRKPVAKGTVLKAAAFLNDQRISPITTQTYFVFSDSADRYPYPVVSLSSPADSLFSEERGIYVPGAASEPDDLVWTGNYFNSGRAWERVTSFEYFEAGEPVINQTVGLRIHGGKTRGAAQKSLRVYARSEYGKKDLEHPFFGDDGQSSYRHIILRTSLGSWTNSIITDVFAHQAVKGLNIDIQEYQPVIVFLNGEYWGIHTMRERIGRHKIAAEYGLDDDEINVYASYGDAIDGDLEDTEFIFLRDQYLAQNDITHPDTYAYIQERIDVDNFIDYFLAQVYFNNRDWPANNSKMWRSAAYDNKFRWLYYDLDAAMGQDNVDNNLLSRLLDEENANRELSWSTRLVRSLIKNDDFRTRFVDRARHLLQTTLNPATLTPILDSIVATYEPAMEEHQERWWGQPASAAWKRIVSNHIYRFVLLRNCEMEGHLINQFGIEPFLDCTAEEVSRQLNVYPNPSSGVIRVDSDNPEGAFYQYQIHDQLGRHVLAGRKELYRFGEPLDLSALPQGFYYLSVFDERGGTVSTVRIVMW